MCCAFCWLLNLRRKLIQGRIEWEFRISGPRNLKISKHTRETNHLQYFGNALWCCDGKSRVAYAQSFALWQQGTIEFTCHDHSIIACSRHVYLWCCSSRTSRSWWITQSTQHHRRGCNNIPSFLQRTAPIARSLCEGWTWHDLHILVTASGETSTLGQRGQIAVVGARVKTVKYMTSSCSFNLGTTFLQHSFPYKLRPNPRPPALC